MKGIIIILLRTVRPSGWGTFVWLPFLIFSFELSFAQEVVNPDVDSLVRYLPESTGIEKVDLLSEISWAYRNTQPDSSLKYATHANALAIELKYQDGITKSLNFMGIAHRNKSAYTTAFELFIRALKAAENSENEEQICYSLINLGNIYIYQTNYSGALEYFQKAFERAEQLGNKNISVYCLLNIGRAYTGMKDYVQAAKYYEQTRQLRKELGDMEGYVIATVDLGGMYFSMGKADDALEVYRGILKEIVSMDHKGTLAYSYITLGKIFLHKNMMDSARIYSEKSLRISRSYGFKKDESEALLTLSKIYEIRNKYVESLDFHKAYVQSKDSVFNEENTRKIEVLSAHYVEEKLEAEKSLLKKQTEIDELLIRRQESIIYWTGLVSFLLFVIAVLFFWFWNQRRRLTNEITRQNEASYKHNIDLLELNNEKNNLIRILSHDLRAPINNIKSLAYLIQLDLAKPARSDENESLEHIKSESDRLLTMIRKILDVEAIETAKVPKPQEKVNMRSLLLRVTSAYKESAISKKLEIIPMAGKEDLFVNGDEVHLTQVIENLLSNAIKFSKEHKKIWASLALQDGLVRVTIKDEGPGLTDDDKSKIFTKFQQLSAKPTGDEESTGLGLSIVKRYTEEMNGKIWYESEPGSGTSFTIEFKRVA